MTIRGGPPMSNTRTSLPQIKSKFDLEPNPFEQSFKDNPSETIRSSRPNTISPSLDHLLNAKRSRRARSSSPHHFATQPLPTPPAIRQSPDSNLVKISLPGINFITSPAMLIHHSGTDSSKSPSSSSLTAPQSVHPSRPSSMLAYPWNFGGLDDSLRTGPLSPALLDGPTTTRATQSTTHTGLTPLLESDGVITPGTQALIALLSSNEENSGPMGGQDRTLSSTAFGTSSSSTDLSIQNQSDHSMNLAHRVDQNLRSTLTISTPSSNPESLSAVNHRSAGSIFTSIASLHADTTSKSSTSSSSALVDSSASVNRPIQPVTDITTPLSPTPTCHNIITPVPPNPGDGFDYQYNSNPLYLLTVAHEESSRMSKLSNHVQALDDATATAAAALTGLGSSGGSRYSSPGPSINPNGVMNSQHPLINNLHSSQSIMLGHEGEATIPLQPNPLTDPSSINPRAILCADHETNMVSAHQASPFSKREPLSNSFLPEGNPMASGSKQPSYSAPNLDRTSSTTTRQVDHGRQSISSLDLSAVKKKGKKRKETGDIESANAQQNAVNDSQLLHSKGELSSCFVGSSASRHISKSTRPTAATHKTKKSKKSKIKDASGDDSDSRDGYWGPEDEASFLRSQGLEEVDSAGYSAQPTNSNYYSNPSGTQPSSTGKPEIEEEKRKNFLERNRQAALKCRQRKKAWLANLQTKIEFLSTENESLQSTINRLREEVDSFRNILISHKDCPLNIAGGHGAAATIGDMMGRDSAFVAASAAAILTQQHHENNGRVVMRHPTVPNSLHGQAHMAATLSSTNRSMRRFHHNSHGGVAPSFGY